MRVIIRPSEVMEITGWSRSKTYDRLSTIKYVCNYPPQRKDVSIKDFCDVEGFDEQEIRKAIKTPET
jgi:predicted DNA-binding transcriptional regulator AlpA